MLMGTPEEEIVVEPPKIDVEIIDDFKEGIDFCELSLETNPIYLEKVFIYFFVIFLLFFYYLSLIFVSYLWRRTLFILRMFLSFFHFFVISLFFFCSFFVVIYLSSLIF